MLQPGRDPRLTLKPPRIGEPVSHHLHRNQSLKLLVGSLPHIAHGP